MNGNCNDRHSVINHTKLITSLPIDQTLQHVAQSASPTSLVAIYNPEDSSELSKILFPGYSLSLSLTQKPGIQQLGEI